MPGMLDSSRKGSRSCDQCPALTTSSPVSTYPRASRAIPAGSWVHERLLDMPDARGLDNLPIATVKPEDMNGKEAVVVNFKAGPVERTLSGEDYLKHWSTPNGYSVIAGAARIEGDYLLMMADHIFEASILQRLAKAGTKSRGVTLAIDRRTDSPLVDPDDATWVKTDADGRIEAIGKSIAELLAKNGVKVSLLPVAASNLAFIFSRSFTTRVTSTRRCGRWTTS